MDRRTYLTATSMALASALAGCSEQLNPDAPTETPASETGVLAAAISDGPSAIDDFESLVVTVEEIWLHPSKQDRNGGENDEGDSEDTETLRELTATTDSEGTASVTIPSDLDVSTVDTISLKATHGETEGELEYERADGSLGFESEGTSDAPFDIAFDLTGTDETAVTVTVTEDGEPVQDATIEIKFERQSEADDDEDDTEGDQTQDQNQPPADSAVAHRGHGRGNEESDKLSLTTDADGRVTFEIPDATESIDVNATHDDAEGELEYEFGESDETDDGSNDTESDESGGDEETDEDEDEEKTLAVSFVGEVSQGAEATVEVTSGGEPVQDATVEVEFDGDSDRDGEEEPEGPENETEGDKDESDTSDEGDGAEDDGKIVIEVEDKQVDLVEVQGDAKSFVAETELEVGEFESLKLQISDEVDFTLKDGDESETSVETPGNAPLQFNESFEIRADTRTAFTADFAPHTRGKNNSQGYLLKPVPSEINVSYEPLETDDETGNETDAETGNPADGGADGGGSGSSQNE